MQNVRKSSQNNSRAQLWMFLYWRGIDVSTHNVQYVLFPSSFRKFVHRSLLCAGLIKDPIYSTSIFQFRVNSKTVLCNYVQVFPLPILRMGPGRLKWGISLNIWTSLNVPFDCLIGNEIFPFWRSSNFSATFFHSFESLL